MGGQIISFAPLFVDLRKPAYNADRKVYQFEKIYTVTSGWKFVNKESLSKAFDELRTLHDKLRNVTISIKNEDDRYTCTFSSEEPLMMAMRLIDILSTPNEIARLMMRGQILIILKRESSKRRRLPQYKTKTSQCLS